MTREQARERAKKVAGAFYEATCSMREADRIDAIAKLMLFERAEQAEEDAACAEAIRDLTPPGYRGAVNQVNSALIARASELRQAAKGE